MSSDRWQACSPWLVPVILPLPVNGASRGDSATSGVGRTRRWDGERRTTRDAAEWCDAGPLSGRRTGNRARTGAAPFSRGSPDVTVALFNYSHAYDAPADALRANIGCVHHTHIRHPCRRPCGIRLTRRIMFCATSALPQDAQSRVRWRRGILPTDKRTTRNRLVPIRAYLNGSARRILIFDLFYNLDVNHQRN